MLKSSELVFRSCIKVVVWRAQSDETRNDTHVFLVFHFKKNQLDFSSYNVTQFPLFAREVLPFGIFGEAVPPVFSKSIL